MIPMSRDTNYSRFFKKPGHIMSKFVNGNSKIKKYIKIQDRLIEIY